MLSVSHADPLFFTPAANLLLRLPQFLVWIAFKHQDVHAQA
jgi:hypothetical protein